MKYLSYLCERLRKYEWLAYRKCKRTRLKITDFSILATNCIGGVMYHDLGLEFLTPTVNLTISLRDLVKLAENPRWYMEQPLVEIQEPGPCPAGLLGDVRVNFVHYASFEEGAGKWEERKRKINWDRLVLMGTDQGNCDYETLQRFDRLSWPNKLVFTHRPYSEFSSACYIKGFEEQDEVGVLTNFKPGFRKRRFLDDFDYVAFLNRIK